MHLSTTFAVTFLSPYLIVTVFPQNELSLAWWPIIPCGIAITFSSWPLLCQPHDPVPAS